MLNKTVEASQNPRSSEISVFPLCFVQNPTLAAPAVSSSPHRGASKLLNGKIASKSVDKLLCYAGRLGIEAKAKFSQTHKAIVEKELTMAGMAG